MDRFLGENSNKFDFEHDLVFYYLHVILHEFYLYYLILNKLHPKLRWGSFKLV